MIHFRNISRFYFLKNGYLLGIALSFAIIPLIASAASLGSQNICLHAWNRTLTLGAYGSDVHALQQFLNVDPQTTLTPLGLGSPGHETNFYGAHTASAVARFQKKYTIAATGSLDMLTRAIMNALCTASAATAYSTTTTAALSTTAAPTTATSTAVSTTTDDALTVSDPGQPLSSLAPAGSGSVPFISITLAAGNKDVTVNSIAVRRIGIGTDGAFANIALNDPSGFQIGNLVSFDSNHTTLFKQPFTIPAHTSETVAVVGNMANDLSNFVGQKPNLQIDSIHASSPIVGAFPFVGSPQTLNNTLVIGGALATVSPFDPNTPTNHYIGDTGVRFSGIRITANSQEDITLSSIIWNQIGTAAADDLAHVTTFANGTSSSTTIRPDGKTYVSIFNPVIVIPKGQSVDVYIQGDLGTTGANRTVEFDIYDNTDDVSLTGNTYGFGVGLSPSGNTAATGHSVFITSDGTTGGNTGTPFFAGSVLTIKGGSASYIGK